MKAAPRATSSSSAAAAARARIAARSLFVVGVLLGIYSIATPPASIGAAPPRPNLVHRPPSHGHGHGHAGAAHDAHAGHSHGAATAALPAVAPLEHPATLSPGLLRALRSSGVLGAPSRVTRRTYRDAELNADVSEESAYFDVPRGVGKGVARAVVGEQEAAIAEGAPAVDEVLVLRNNEGEKGEGGAGGDAGAARELGGAPTPPVDAAGAVIAPPLPPLVTTDGNGAGKAAAAAVLADGGDWVPLHIPTRPADWVPAQRVIPGEHDAIGVSHAFSESTVASDIPPAPRTGATGLELSHRLVIAIAMGVHSGGVRVEPPGSLAALEALPIIKVLLGTLLPTAQPHHEYRIYLAYDHNDPVYEVAANRDALRQLYSTRFAEEDATRWHPQGSDPAVIDNSRLVASLHWVHCDYAGKPSWAHSDAVVAAVKEGADYVYRSNDDSKFPPIGDWADRFIIDLRARSPVANVGVTGPTCNEGATWILTHDFTHATHARIFGYAYPRALPNWSSDDWITFVYASLGLQTKLPEAIVGHTFVLGTRYEPDPKHVRLAALNGELRAGAAMIAAWLLEHHGVTLPYEVKVRDCC